MTSPYCEKIKRGDDTVTDFAAFLHHVSGCKDCLRRIKSRMIVEFAQKVKEKHGDK